MKSSVSILTTTLILLLSGCLAHMTATNVATRLNNDAYREGSPYRWYVVDLEGDRARLEQRLTGKVAPSKTSDSKKQAVLGRIEELEETNGRTGKPALIETRILDEKRGKTVEAWVFVSSGKEVTYMVEHTVGTDDKTFFVRGPWVKRS